MSVSTSPPVRPDLGALRITPDKRKKNGSRKRWLWVVLVIVVLSLLALGGFAYKNAAPKVEVAVASKPAGNLPAGVLNASGYVTPRRRATIAAKITGRVTQIFFDEGTRVKEGQLLATLDDSDAQRALASAKADRDAAQATIADYRVQLKNANIELHRAQELQKSGVQSQQVLDTATMTAESLQAKIALAQQQVAAAEARIQEQEQAVANCTIRAPFSGIAVSKDAQVGEMVSPVSAGGGFTRTGIATLVDLHSNEIEVDVNESYIAKVKADQPVNAVLDAYPDAVLPAKVRTVIPTADRQKATVKVRISFAQPNHIDLYDPANDPRILPDMGVKVTFLEDVSAAKSRSGKTAALALVPSAAIRSDGDSKYVFVLKDRTVERRGVTVGGTVGSDVEILGGLQPDTRVVVKGLESLRDGQTVQVTN